MAIARKGFFDFVSTKMGDLEVVLFGGKKDNATCMPHDDGSGGMFIVGIEFFDGEFVGFVFNEEFGEVFVKSNEPSFDGIFGGELENACFNEARLDVIGVKIDDAIACDSRAGVDAHDANGSIGRRQIGLHNEVLRIGRMGGHNAQNNRWGVENVTFPAETVEYA